MAGALIGVIATWVADTPDTPAQQTALAFGRLFRS
ncbi:hypothetical protein HNR23_001715 [Nocardiopsis mwathae]|uniref:Uncharacterized protein n=1 Tax=Nocardiopsis mwathae TaxID=1472723 RepID=A0A7W9YGC9_9ACTN|nr:hypothetical protein [Nocardiopsis mwathae]